MNKSTIVFFGEDSFSTIVYHSLLEAGHRIPLAVSPLYEDIRHKRLENSAVANGTEYLRAKNINSEAIVEKIRYIKPDLICVAHFERIIKSEILQIPRLGCLNLHPSLLPLYRGLSPQHFPIINGEDKTGITIHFINEGIDTGNIVLQKEIALTDKMYVADLQLIWAKMYKTVMCEAVERVLHGEKGIQQTGEGSYYGRLESAQCRICPEKGIVAAYNLIRGVSMPYQGAFLDGENERLIIWRAEIISDKPLTAIGKAEKKDGKLYLSFNDGTLLITKELKIEN